MFSNVIRTNSQSSNQCFYFLQCLFLLHMCTAFLTIVNALNNHENEAFIQLSVDSIHVVKPSDPRFLNIEENANDEEEKELLIALLTSFEDDYTNLKHTDNDKPPDIMYSTEVSSKSNCTSSSTAGTMASSSSSSIRFIPPILDFGEQSIAIPRVQTVTIINDNSEPLELQSLSGTTVQFYSSFFTQKVLPSNGGNTSINVYYLPRTLGSIKSTFTIKTNHRTIQYHVNGVGVTNPFHVRPLIGATIPFNSTFEYTVHFHNPYNYSIDINEVYTSDENLIIELLSYKSQKTKITKAFEHTEQWHLEPYETKAVFKINYLGYKLDRLHGFYCIKTTSNDTIIAPVEISVLNEINLYSNVDLLEFSPDSLIRSTARPITISVYVINNGVASVPITDVRVTASNSPYVKVQYEKIQVPGSIHHLTKVAELTIHPYLIPSDLTRIRGSVEIYTTLSNSDEPTLRIPLRATVLHGSLDYDKEATYFYIPSSPVGSTNDDKQTECRPIRLKNRFDVPIAIYNVTIDKTSLLSHFINMKIFSTYVYANPGQSVFPVCISTLKQTVSPNSLITLEASLAIHTNLSFFHMPIYIYSGLLNLDYVADNTNGGIKRNDVHASEFYIASIPVNVSRTVKFALQNVNPIDISVDKISLTLPNANIRLAQVLCLNGSETKVTYKSSYENEDITEVIIPSRHRAIFSLTIHGTSDPSFYDESISFKTRYQTISMNLKYRITSGSIELENKLPLHIDVFPNRIGTVDILINNAFDEPTEVLRIEFPTYGKAFSFIWNHTSPGKLIIPANRTYLLGKLAFDMKTLCANVQVPSESTCYCGLNHHPEFRQKWNQQVDTLNNNYELDHILVSKFRSLWQEWTSLVRKQRVRTNIWLVTDQANISWPITIGFVWPSVLEHMSSKLSRLPVILDFHLTFINNTKTQNIIISNPSSNILQYSIELVDSLEHSNKKSVQTRENQVFDIGTASKGVKFHNGMFKFSLLPNELLVFTATFRPQLSVKQENYVVVRNNLTIMESILLRGEGGKGSLTVGNRKAGSSDIPLLLEMNEKQYKICSEYLTTEGLRGNPILQKVVALRNTGNMKVTIHDVSFGRSKCSGQGFSVNVCSNIDIEPNERYDLRINFQPDYTLAEIAESLTLSTNIGPLIFPIVVRIPQRVLATCYQTVPRPGWEALLHWFCLISVGILLLCILSIAVYEAQRLFYDYLARAELRRRLSIADQRLFEFSDITAAVQTENKNRERIESRSSVTVVEAPKDTLKDEAKPKENDTKVKRSHVSVNGTKDNGDVPPKITRNLDVANTSVRSASTSSKVNSQKPKRSITDNSITKNSKQQEPPPKVHQIKTQKSNNTEPATGTTPNSLTPPSPNPPKSITDEENNSFMPVRPRRVSCKAKEVTNSIILPKPTPTVDPVVPLQSSNSPTSISPSTAPSITEKSSTRLDNAEQRKDQQDPSGANDTDNDQQWQKVGSYRSSRKGISSTSIRRETPDESQTTNKTNKTTPTVVITSNNIENPVVLQSSSSHLHTSVSNQMAQSRRRRGRHLTRTVSPTDVPVLTKRKSLQTDTPLSIHNRELAFRQLAEQLWAAGLPSSTTACSMSVRSRCSSAPPSERGGGDDESTKVSWNIAYDNQDENVIDWDAPDKPDEDFGRYSSQIELVADESNGHPQNNSSPNEWMQQPLIPQISDTSPFPSSSTVTNIAKIPTAINTEELEPSPSIQHGPGPIRRPNKLTCSPTQKSQSTSFFMNSVQSPETPDVLDQINRLLDHQDSATPATPIVSVNDSTMSMNDLMASNIPWTPFASTTWPSKYDSPWSSAGIQSPTVSLATHIQNPFATISAGTEQQRPSNRQQSTVWSSVDDSITPRSIPSNTTRMPQSSIWNDAFSTTKSTNNSWSKFLSSPDSLPIDGATSNGHDIEANNTFWNLGTLTGEPMVPIATVTQSPTDVPPVWWSNTTSDENNNCNNNNGGNHNHNNTLNDDVMKNRDRSRWDFAR